MADILIVLPVAPVRSWMADALKAQGYGVAAAANVAEALRLLAFGSFASLLAWLAPGDLQELVARVSEMCPRRPGLGILSWDAQLPVYSPWFDQGTDRVILLPATSASLLEAVGDLCRLDSADAWRRAAPPTVSVAPLSTSARCRPSKVRIRARHSPERQGM